ncbi:uncharacterized protein LTR77_008304 [Saxophila tyrrhenica]|uniref:Filamentation protein n=1 Tax=Saxophila tyrrhenica TaxID=1690608 RepID=A0AAV9P160_9PEZI|nr:hypothetical protein LTR77_008304 [Saxophila tyrrhenica]
MSAPNADKGARYLAQLDQALCNGSWSDIQELARKTDKHAPERRCFTLAARSEAQIASASHRPTSAASTTSASIHSLGELVPKLEEAIAAASVRHSEDAYAARVCLAELYWLRHESGSALQALSSNDERPAEDGNYAPTLGWLEVCDVKATFLRAASLEAGQSLGEAQKQYSQAAVKAPGSRTPELRVWTERLLARGCLFMKRNASPTLEVLSDTFSCFQAWSDFWQRSPPSTTSGGSSHLDIPRREVWKAYYDVLSKLLQYGLVSVFTNRATRSVLVVPSREFPDHEQPSAKIRLRIDLKRVELTYESLLLTETQFPKASQSNTEIEQWVEQAISNWKVLAGSDWTDHELGEGGKESLGRGVLDILYRSATKTFHSTAILRHLFTVHASLGDFDLAMHAFDSYVEIVGKGKARATKTGKHEIGFDSDDTAVLTAANALRVLCRYGDREDAEKALELRNTIESWLQLGESQPGPAMSLQQSTVAAAYRAIGVSQAQWARWTYEADARPALRADALSTLAKARQYAEDDMETSYSLALLFAESGDVSAAVDVLQQAISASTPADSEDEGDDHVPDFQRERDLVPLWHLLTLCLTAKDDHQQATRMGAAAFEQFGDPDTLFGESSNQQSVESEQRSSSLSAGLVDQMNNIEKAGFLQVKMTQIAMLELTEGSEAAVSVSHELLALYARLFGNPDRLKPAAGPPPTATSAAPAKAGGTLRSFAGSIRPKSKRSSQEKAGYKPSSLLSLPEDQEDNRSAQAGGANDVPIAITVTNEEGVATEKAPPHRLPFKLRGHHGDWREHGNLKSTRSVEAMQEKSSPLEQRPAVPLENAAKSTSGPDGHQAAAVQPAIPQSMTERSDGNPQQPLKGMQHNVPHDALPAPTGHGDQQPQQDIRLPTRPPGSAASPGVRLASTQDRKHRISLVVEVWLFIAGLYLRADLLDDASGAVMEAHKFVDVLEAEAAAENTNARGLFQKGWGGGKSVDHLWADVWAVKGDLSIAREQPWRALEAYEQSVGYFPDHSNGIIGLSNLLMDIYEEKLPVEEPRQPFQNARHDPVPPRPSLIQMPINHAESDKPRRRHQHPTPTEINRLAARDRAYMLLSSLTRLGSGWDDSEAWYTLARAHELSGQISKAKKALWWVVKLEENKPIRPWSDIGPGGFTL